MAAAAVLALFAAPVAMAQITGYTPSSVCPGETVRLVFKESTPALDLRIGTDGGNGIPVPRDPGLTWPQLRVPESTDAGTYWIAIVDGAEIKKGPRSLTVRSCDEPPGPGIDVGPLEFATEGYAYFPEIELLDVDQIGGRERVPVGQDLRLRLRVRNEGPGEANFRPAAIHRSEVALGEASAIPARATRDFTLALPIREGDPGGTLTVFLAHTGPDAGNLFTAMFKDDNQGNNMEPFSYGVAAGSYDVTVEWARLQILHRCDDLSPGDWRFRVGGYASSWENEVIPGTFGRALMSMQRDVGEETISTPQRMELPNVSAEDTISIRSSGWECDSDEVGAGALDWARIFVWPHYWEAVGAALGAAGSFDNCHGDEEVHEWTGKHDTLGTRSIDLTPTQWQNGGRFELGAGELGSCRAQGRHPYRFWVRVRAVGR